MEIREIEAFLVLAEELHFGRAGERLGVSSGRVSQLIGALERRIGGTLAVRTSRSVHLTELGEQFVKDARAGYDLLQDSVVSARAEAAREGGVLHVGASKFASVPVVTELCEAFEHRYPQWRIRRVATNGHQMWAPLHSGDVDLLFGRLPCPPGSVPEVPGIVLGPVVSLEGRVVLAAETHPLARRASVSVEELVGYAMVAWSPEAVPAWFKNAWAPQVTPGGHPIPRGDEPAVESEEVYDQIVRRGLLHIAPASALQIIPWPRVTAIPLTGLLPFHITLARAAVPLSPPVSALLSLAARTSTARQATTRAPDPQPGRAT